MSIIKRILAISMCALLLVAVVALPACTTGAENDVLAHQQFPFTVQGDIIFGLEEYTIQLELTAPMTATLSFTAPETLVGYVFSISSEQVTLSFGNITIPYTSDSVPGGSLLIPQMFSLDHSQLINTSQTEQNSIRMTVATFNTPYGEITLFVNNSTGQPIRVESTHNGTPVVFRINSISPSILQPE